MFLLSKLFCKISGRELSCRHIEKTKFLWFTLVNPISEEMYNLFANLQYNWTEDQIYGSTTGSQIIVPNRLRSVEGIALDWVAKNLYFTDGSYGTLSVVRLKSTNFEDRRELLTQLGNPRAVVTHPSVGYVTSYWLNQSTRLHITCLSKANYYRPRT